MQKLFLALSFFYLFIVVIFIGFTEVHDSSVVYADYVPTPQFTQDTPSVFKQLFFSVAQDGENSVSQQVTNSDVVFHGLRNSKQVALTFDADMTPWMKEQVVSGAVQSYYNRDLIAYLEQTNTKATLFLTGMWIELYHDDAVKLANDPLFELGSHSYSHPSFSGYCYGLASSTPQEQEQEVDKTQNLLFDLTGKPNTLFRFPGGCYSQDNLTMLSKKGLQPIQWDVVGGDGFNDNTQAIVNNVLNNVHNGSIIVMHMNGYPNDPKTSEALPQIVETLKEEGYTFVTVSDLLSQNVAQAKVNELQYLKNYLSDQEIKKEDLKS